jgi:hypothetical protein
MVVAGEGSALVSSTVAVAVFCCWLGQCHSGIGSKRLSNHPSQFQPLTRSAPTGRATRTQSTEHLTRKFKFERRARPGFGRIKQSLIAVKRPGAERQHGFAVPSAQVGTPLERHAVLALAAGHPGPALHS